MPSHPNHAAMPVQAGNRATWNTPSLNRLGDVRLLTETGSTPGAEDTDGKPDNCNGQVTTTFNSCRP